MSFQDQLSALFVNENEIPEQYRIEEIHQREYLSNGELKKWSGEVSEVYSPIMVPTADGLKTQTDRYLPYRYRKRSQRGPGSCFGRL